MEKFMLIIREDLKKLRDLAEARAHDMEVMPEWTRSLMEWGNYVDSEPLETTGRYVTNSGVMSDGPFIEAKEGIAGFYIIAAENLNQAVSIAQTCPLVMQELAVIEVRPVMSLE